MTKLQEIALENLWVQHARIHTTISLKKFLETIYEDEETGDCYQLAKVGMFVRIEPNGNVYEETA